MKMIQIKYKVSALLAGLLLCSCTDKEDYTPGEPASAENWGVYFDADNESEYIREPEDAAVIDIKIKRSKTDGELTVPLETSQVVGQITAPTSVTFANGESEKTIKIEYAGFPEVKPQMTLSFPENYTNVYKKKEGASKQLIAVKKAEVITQPFTMNAGNDYVSETIFSKSESVIKWVVGENKFIFINFFGSGIDLKFRIDTDHGGKFNKDDITACYGSFEPLSNACMEDYDDEDGQYGGWYLSTVSKAKDDSPYATWTPEGSNTSITEYMYFSSYYGDPSEASSYTYSTFYFDANPAATKKSELYGYGYIWIGGTIFDDKDWQDYSTKIYLLDDYVKKQ